MKTKTAQHTPGPWEVVAINLDGWPLPTKNEYPNADVSFGIVKESGAVITQEEIEMDARLIAAAPELLAFIAELVEGAQSETPQPHDLLPRAIALITKATGQEAK